MSIKLIETLESINAELSSIYDILAGANKLKGIELISKVDQSILTKPAVNNFLQALKNQ